MTSLVDTIKDAIFAKRLTHRIEANGVRWVAEDELCDLIRRHEAEQPQTLDQWQQVLNDAIAYRKLKTAESGWVEWSGGECPVAPDEMVEIEHRNGQRKYYRADRYWWSHLGWVNDIIRYRTTHPQRKQP